MTVTAVSAFLFIILFHWINDFVLQDESWANNKSKSLKALLKHTATYSLMWLLPVWIFTNSFIGASLFVIITFLFHTITDYFTSKVVAKRFQKNYFGSPIPNFGAFSIIGFDQLLHYTQLILTWYLIF